MAEFVAEIGVRVGQNILDFVVNRNRRSGADTVLVKDLAYAKIAVVDISSLGLARERAARPKHSRNLAGRPEGQRAQRPRGAAHRDQDLSD